nr:immunoglobulin light chain junction region [Macaca mulatta]
CMQGLVFPWTF